MTRLKQQTSPVPEELDPRGRYIPRGTVHIHWSSVEVTVCTDSVLGWWKKKRRTRREDKRHYVSQSVTLVLIGVIQGLQFNVLIHSWRIWRLITILICRLFLNYKYYLFFLLISNRYGKRNPFSSSMVKVKTELIYIYTLHQFAIVFVNE